MPLDSAFYNVIGPEHPGHSHGDNGLIDFSMAAFCDGTLELGKPSSDMDSYWHVHLKPAQL